MTLRFFVPAIAAALLTAAVAAPAAAQDAPGWSRGQQALDLAYDVCVSRMPQALRAEGYRVDSTSGNAAVGVKGYHTAVIICSPAARGQLVQIVVASNGPGGGDERVRLQAQMGGTATAQGTTPNGGTVPNWTIMVYGCTWLGPQLTAALTQDANGLIGGTANGNFNNQGRPVPAKVVVDPGPNQSRIVGSGLKLTLLPQGWTTNLIFNGTWDGMKFAGPVDLGDDKNKCTFTMFRS